MTDQHPAIIDLHPHIAAARRGERRAQHRLYAALAPRVFGVCLRYARDRPEADDMAQEAWVRAFTRLDGYRDDGSFEGWLRRVTVNTCISYLRKRRRLAVDDLAAERLAEGDAPLPSALHVAPAALAELSAQELAAHVAALPEGFRLVFNLVALEGYSHAEAAEALGITESTSRSQLTRGRAWLQRRLAKFAPVCL